MTKTCQTIALTITLATVVTLSGCEKSESSTSSPPVTAQPAPTQPKAAQSAAKPQPTTAPKPAMPAMPHGNLEALAAPLAGLVNSGAVLEGSTLKLAGLNLTMPSEWTAEPTPTGPMAPKAVFSMPGAEETAEAGSVRITHYPSMKGKDEMNIDRWIGQARKADGTPMTRADAKIEKKELGNVRLTTVDITGAIQATMRSAPKAGTRMIAAIVDHPKGPHFVSIVGDEKTMGKWEQTITKFLASAKVE